MGPVGLDEGDRGLDGLQQLFARHRVGAGDSGRGGRGRGGNGLRRGRLGRRAEVRAE